ncbi:MAG: TIGR00282 family metallophosphoesterase [Acidobacteriota bacterium]
MKILFVGDIVGRPGRQALKARLSEVQGRNEIDFTIVNVENAAGGFGITPPLVREILARGVDVMTSGNHVWDKKEILDYFPAQPRLLRPGNYPPGLPGEGQVVAESRGGIPVAVMNLQGRVFMPIIDCPFQCAERQVPKLSRQAKVIIMDFHAEATSEKMAMGWFLDGKVSAVIGTHTHVPTADTRVLPQGTAFVTDVGMTGSYESVIGMKTQGAILRFQTGVTSRLQVATAQPRFSSMVIDVDESTGHARSIRRLDLEI